MTFAKEYRQRAWEALRGSYWKIIGAFLAQALGSMGLLFIAVLFLPIMDALDVYDTTEVGIALDAISQGVYDQIPFKDFSFGVVGCILFAATVIYLTGFVTWGIKKVSIATMRGEMKFSLWDSGYGHGWHMTWVLSVKAIYIYLWSLLFFVPGIIKAFSYAMTDYIAVDHPDWTASQCITASRRMMSGHRWSLFCLGFSFTGWIFLAFVIGMIVAPAGFFLQPYICTAMAAFYEERKAEIGESHF